MKTKVYARGHLTQWEIDYTLVPDVGLFKEYLEIGEAHVVDCIRRGTGLWNTIYVHIHLADHLFPGDAGEFWMYS